MNLKTAALLLFPLALTSCNDNELDINAPWKETPVVYAVIDAENDSQIFRIQKTYQNNVNQATTDVAQLADSLTLKNIEVSVVNNTTGVTIPLKKVAPRKENGFFSNKDSSYWGEAFPAGFFNGATTYKLVIKSNNTGNTYTAVSNAVTPVSISRPQLKPDGSRDEIDIVPSESKGIFRITGGGRNTSYYTLLLRITYTEAPSWDPGNTTTKSLDHNFLSRTQLNSDNMAFIVAYDKGLLFNSIQGQIKKDPNLVRSFVKLEYVAICINKTYSEMVEVNSPSLSVVGKSQDFSNISGGIGIFGGRTVSIQEQSPLTPASVSLVNQYLNP